MEGASKSKSSPKALLSSYPGVSIPPSWEEAAEAIAYDSATCPPPIALICGPGNCGKSTFSRLLLDTLFKRYKRVGYLDTDLGQPEFTTPGCLSLHVVTEKPPDFSILCLKMPERCLFFGNVSPKEDPETYLKYIFSLYDYFNKEYHQSRNLGNHTGSMLPLIINTPGWVKGAGYDMLVNMLRYMSPSHVVQMRLSAEDKNLPTGTFWLDKNQRESVTSVEICAAYNDSLKRAVSIKREARIMRDLRIVAYFRQCLPMEFEISSYNELARSLACIPPYEISLSRIKVMHLHHQVSSPEVFHSLNSTIVGLAISSSVPSSTKNCTSWCHGLGIVRSVDFSRKLLYVITPIPRCRLEKVDLLLQSSIEIPACLSQNISEAS